MPSKFFFRLNMKCWLFGLDWSDAGTYALYLGPALLEWTP